MRKLSRICGYSRKFSPWNLEVWHPLVWHKRAIHRSFLREIVFFSNSRKFSPSKVSRYTVVMMSLVPTLHYLQRLIGSRMKIRRENFVRCNNTRYIDTRGGWTWQRISRSFRNWRLNIFRGVSIQLLFGAHRTDQRGNYNGRVLPPSSVRLSSIYLMSPSYFAYWKWRQRF